MSAATERNADMTPLVIKGRAEGACQCYAPARPIPHVGHCCLISGEDLGYAVSQCHQAQWDAYAAFVKGRDGYGRD